MSEVWHLSDHPLALVEELLCCQRSALDGVSVRFLTHTFSQSLARGMVTKAPCSVQHSGIRAVLRYRFAYNNWFGESSCS